VTDKSITAKLKSDSRVSIVYFSRSFPTFSRTVQAAACNNFRKLYKHITHALSPERYQRQLRHFSETPTLYQNDSLDKYCRCIGGKPIAARSQSISGVNAVNPLVAFYNIQGRKIEVLFFCSVPDITLDITIIRRL
jgi:hypothetical protein